MRKKAAQTRSLLIKQLANGDFNSGELLGELVGVSRSAVANHIKYLTNIGLDVFSVKGRGYRLASPLQLLDQNKISALLGQQSTNVVEVVSIIDSTNTYVKEHLHQLPKGYVCLAEAQTHGRGRRGKTWVSPFGSSIYMSMAWTFKGGYQSMAGLSLLVGIAINRSLKTMGIKDCKLKWPNDVFHNCRKLAGILVEVEGQVGSDASAVIGIGINVDLPNAVSEIDQPFVDLVSITQKPVDRNELVALIILTLTTMLTEFELKGLAPFLSEWREADLFYNEYVYLESGSNRIHGLSKGINEGGALMLENAGKVTPHHGGEISVRKS
ncbi:bifunctional biotin--[acetyl-CoA-carboxylase] ligase/biotin operon repressor BirA [Brumicola nitratireducens]|uniref:Bifunctional ligase/repressor BirA n=1 Tax=Glaciecola nitratireducens (strain JCM 12485 / KCTC 12276 / FR1064) TaxID=1085623 RepID=G4QFN4_GLANF|nr:bifunctional biotin--[acetyl-CoA-carboxylase] ligase/biotin operon repressor BirA [Glaciecola nitratireducens]AEP28819.1 biotin--acetyl-CoA-carboxylase ligase [Glaciecola nitratireducens FR1064]